MEVKQMDNTKVYSEFDKRKQQLAQIIKRTADIVTSVDIKDTDKDLNTLSAKVSNDTFKVQVIGGFSAGKSTIINALLGEDILPAFSYPTTAIINEIKYSEQKKATLFFRNPIPKNIPDDFAPEAIAHIKKYGGKNVPPLIISADKETVEKYVVIPEGAENMMRESPYKNLELLWPLELLKNGVEIIDSPGLNDEQVRTEVTEEYSNHADAVLYAINSGQACAQTDMNEIQRLVNNKFNKMYFLINKFDTVPEREKPRFIRTNSDKLSGYTNQKNGIFYISALSALEGRMENNSESYAESGFAAFENELSHFLVDEKGIEKISGPAHLLLDIIDSRISKKIKSDLELLSVNAGTIRKRYNDALPRLEKLNQRKMQLAERLSTIKNRTQREIYSCVNTYFDDLIRRIPVYVNECELQNSFSVLHPKRSSEKIAEELMAHLDGCIDEFQTEWKNETLEELIKNRIDEIRTSIEGNLEQFYIELDDIRMSITGTSSIEGESDIPVWQRVVGAGLGFFTSGIGGALTGGAVGLNASLFKSLGIQLATYLGLYLIGLLNPVTIIATILVTLIATLVGQEQKAVRSIRDKVIETATEEIKKNKQKNIDLITNEIMKKFDNINNSIIKVLDKEIADVKRDVNTILIEVEKGEANIKQKRNALENAAKELDSIKSELNMVVIDFLTGKAGQRSPVSIMG
jgi:GTP-binding protein EngB required for normal cell division